MLDRNVRPSEIRMPNNFLETCRKRELKVKILLVEDNEVNREMLRRRLVKRGYEVVEAADGQQAVDTATAERPDLILMDMMLTII